MGFCITYDSMNRHKSFNTNDGEVQFNKDEIVLPYIDAPKPEDVASVQTFRENFENSTKKEITAAKLARKAQVTIGLPSERDFK